MKNFRKKQLLGFTLIELLVVISVIGFLTTLAVTMLNSARVKARNLKRNADIVQLIKAFQQAADDKGGALPSSEPNSACVSNSCTGVFDAFGNIDAVNTAIEPYIQKPNDSGEFGRGGSGYIYSSPFSYYSSTKPGSWLSWLLEPVANVPGVCGSGSAHLDYSGAILCDVKID